MLLSMESYGICRDFGEEAGFALLKKSGFDACDVSFYYEGTTCLGDDYLENAKRTRAALEKVGLLCNQAHAPFDLQEGEAFDCSNEHYLHIVRAMEYAAYLGAKNIIVHLIPTQKREEMVALNREYYKTLRPYCEKFGIRVAVENDFERRSGKILPLLGNPESLQEFVRSLQSDCFVACVDIGHAALFEDPAVFLGKMDSAILQALHVHDNDRKDDLHLFPFTSQLNWTEICAALSRIGYSGDMTLEVIKGLAKIPVELKTDACVFLAKSGRQLIRMVKNNKKNGVEF